MNVIVMGCGRVGSDLATALCKDGHSVSVVDSTETAFQNLPPDFKGKMVEGEMMSRDVLYRAGIENADALAAVTNDDALNAVVAHIAQSTYDIKHVIVRNYNPDFRPMLEAFNLQVVSPNSWEPSAFRSSSCMPTSRLYFPRAMVKSRFMRSASQTIGQAIAWMN